MEIVDALKQIELVIIAPTLRDVREVAKLHYDNLIFDEPVSIGEETGYLHLQLTQPFGTRQTMVDKKQDCIDTIQAYADADKTEFLNVIEALMAKRFYRANDRFDFGHWERIDAEDIPSKNTMRNIPSYATMMVLHTKYDDEYIDIATSEKKASAGYYVLESRFRDGWYGGDSAIYWNGKSVLREKVVEEVIAMKEADYDNGVNLAWWLLYQTKDHEYMGFSFTTFKDPTE